MKAGHDDQLLFALFALRLGIVSPNQIFEIVGNWMNDPDSHVAAALLDSGVINSQQAKAINNLVSEFVEAHRAGREPSLEMMTASEGPTLRMAFEAEGGPEHRTLGDEEEQKLLDEIPLEFPGHYEMRQMLGLGGQARVLLAYDQHIGREIAFKELSANPDLSKLDTSKKSTQKTVAVAMRFLREAKITGKLEHPNIIPVYELGQRSNGKLYYTMRRVRGKTLASALSTQTELAGRMTLLGHFLDLCNAIAYAHSHGVVHRDIKPANVMVGEFGETVVLDWGIAKVRGKEDSRGVELAHELEQLQATSINQTIDGVALGTPAYMSPEQASGLIEEIGERSDIWSLGVMLYELLTGKAPFAGPNPLAVLVQVRQAKPQPILELCPNAPAELAAVAHKALQKDKQDRYQSAKQLAKDVRAYMTGERVLAYEYTSWELFKRFARKNKRSIAVAAILLITVLVSLVVVSVSYKNELTARQNETQARKREEQARNLERSERLKASYHLAQAYTREAERLMEKRMFLSGRIYAAAALIHNPANPKSPNYQEEVTEQLPGSQVLTVDAVSQVYRSEHRLITGLVQSFSSSEAVTQAVFSPDGKSLAVADMAGYLTVWDVQETKQIYKVKGHDDRLQAVAFSPDGRRLATAGREGTIKVWKFGQDKPLCQSKKAGFAYGSLAFSPNGKWLATGDRKHQVLLWDSTRCKVKSRLTLHDDLVHNVAFSPDGRWVASASWDKTARVIDARTGKIRLKLTGHTDAVHGVAFSPDGKRLATSSYDKTVRIWNSATGVLQGILKGHKDAVTCSVFSPDGRRIATASLDSTVMIWDAKKARLLDAVKAHRESVNSVAFSPDGGLLASASLDRATKLWWIAEQGTLLRLDHSDWAYGIDFSADGRVMATSSWDKTIRLWDAKSGKQLKLLRGHTYGVWAVEFSPDDKRLASGGFDGGIRFWDLASGKSIKAKKGQPGGLYDLTYSPDGKLVATAGRDKTARLWNPLNGKLVRVLAGHGDWVYGVAFSPDGKRLATACGDKLVRIWEVASGKLLYTLKGHSDWATGVDFSSDGKLLATTGKDRQAILWDLETKKEIRRFSGHTQWVNSVRFSPDDRWLVTVGDDSLIIIWETASAKPLLRLKTLQSGTRAIFSPNGQRLAVTDHTAILIYPLKDSFGGIETGTLLKETERVAGLKLEGFDLKVVSGQ